MWKYLEGIVPQTRTDMRVRPAGTRQILSPPNLYARWHGWLEHGPGEWEDAD